jgi:GntR family transcriptional regulator
VPTPSEELRHRIVADVNAGEPGAKLGSERDLAERYAQVQRSPSDVVGVPAFLANQGYVAGTRVLSRKITAPDRTTQNVLRIGGTTS